MTENPVTAVTREVAKHVELKEQMEAVYQDLDPQALIDTLEGETDLSEVLLKIAAQVEDYKALAAATQLRIDDLQARKHRTVKAAETLRAIILQAMDTTGTDKVTGPEMTLSCRRTKGQLVIDDESKIPAAYWKPQDPKLDKKALGEAVKDGAKIDGCHLSNGGLSLTIRVK